MLFCVCECDTFEEYEYLCAKYYIFINKTKNINNSINNSINFSIKYAINVETLSNLMQNRKMRLRRFGKVSKMLDT